MVNHKKITRSVFFVLHFQIIIIIYTCCLKQFIGICNTSEKSEGGCNVYYSAQCSCNGISLIEMYEDSNNYKFIFDDSYAPEKDKLRIGFKNTKMNTLDGVFLTWGSQKMPPREVKNGELLTSIKRTLFTCKNKGVYSMCLKRNDDYDCNDIDEVIITIYIENESDCKASFIIDDKGVNVYINKCSQWPSKLVDPKYTRESVSLHSPISQRSEKNVDIKGNNTQSKDEKKETKSQIKGNGKQSNSQITGEKETPSTQIKDSVNRGYDNGNVKAKEKLKHDSFLEEVKDKITYSNKKVYVSEDIDSTSLSRFKSIVDSLQIYFETELGEVIKEPIFKSRNGNVLSGDSMGVIKKTFLKDKRNNSFSMYPVNKGVARKCRIKILHKGTGDFFYLINEDNKEQPDIFFY